MKQQIIAAALALAATVSQAALVNWGASNNLKFDGTALGGKEIQLYMVGVEGAADVLIDTRKTASSPTKGKLASNVGSQSQKYTDTVAGGAVWTVDDGDLGREYYIVIKHTAGGIDYTYTSSAVASSGLSDTKLGSVSFTFNDTTSTVAGTKDAWVSSVPEPTSGLLLLLGVAGLALKRRRA